LEKNTKRFLIKLVNFLFLFALSACIAFAIYNIQRLSPFLHFVEEKNKKLSLNMKNELSRLSLEISKILKLPLVEILFFINGNHITFGMASNIMMSLHKYPKAHDMILGGIQDYFRKEES